MADELRVVITADASGVGPAVAQATAAVEASADQIAAAQAKATAATKALTAAQIELGAAAEGGNAQAAAIIQEYAAASAEAAAAVASLSASQEVNTASTVSNTAAQRADTAATYNRMEAMGAAKITMGAATGSIGSMEMGLARLAAGSSTLGPLLQSMVPVAIFAAGAFMLFDLGEAIYKAFDLGGDAARDFQVKLTDLDGSYRSLIDETSLEADKLEAANAKLEHKPNPNAIKEALDDALVEADKMNSKLQGLIEKEEALIKMQGLAGSTTQTILGITPGSKDAERDLQQHQIWMEKAVSLQQELAETISFTAVEQGKLTDLQQKQTEYEATTRSLAGQAEEDSFLAKKIEQTEIIIADTKKQTEAIQEQMRLTQAQQIHEKLTAVPHVKSDNLPEKIAEAQAEALHGADAQLPVEQQIIAAMDRQIEINNAKANTTKEGTAAERETLRVIENEIALSKAKEQINALGTERLNATFEQQQKDDEAARKRGEEQVRSQLETEKQLRQQQIEGARETAAAQIEAANEEFDRTQMEIRGQEELGLISHKVAEQRLLDALKLREATTQGALKNEQGLFDPALGEKESLEFQRLENQMTKEAQRAATERERIVQQEATKMEQVYKKVANEFNTDFTRAFNEWATKSQTASQAFGKMLGQMELQVIDFVAKWILNKVEMWAMDKLLQSQGQASELVTQKAANAAMVTSDAGVAAAGTMAYYSAINPLVAPAMAGVAYAETMAYAVMDTGGMMPHMGFAFNKSGSPERVLSPGQTSNFESLVNNGGARNATLHQTNNFGGGVTKEMLDAHTAQTMAKMRGMIRPEALA